MPFVLAKRVLRETVSLFGCRRTDKVSLRRSASNDAFCRWPNPRRVSAKVRASTATELPGLPAASSSRKPNACRPRTDS